jgi:hypothetical protein
MSNQVNQDGSGNLNSVNSPSEAAGQKDVNESVANATNPSEETRRKNSTLSKREIMEQLSKERFPWDE